MLETKNLIHYTNTLAENLLSKTRYPWQVLPLISDFIQTLGPTLSPDEYEQTAETVWIHRSAVIAPSAWIAGPTIIGPETEVRHCAYIRGNALIGDHCVVGNSTEVKNAVLVSHVQVPHYNYVGDSVLGCYSHLGAGAITSNVKSDKMQVRLRCGDEVIETGLRKFGAILGDHADVGCNSVLNPGSVIGSGSRIYPLSMVRGIVPANSIYKNQQEIVEIQITVE